MEVTSINYVTCKRYKEWKLFICFWLMINLCWIPWLFQFIYLLTFNSILNYSGLTLDVNIFLSYTLPSVKVGQKLHLSSYILKDTSLARNNRTSTCSFLPVRILFAIVDDKRPNKWPEASMTIDCNYKGESSYITTNK